MRKPYPTGKIIRVPLLLSFIFILASCSSIKYNAAKSQATMDRVRAGQKYAVFTHQNQKYFMEVTSIERDSLVGLYRKERFSIAKKDIRLIRKNNTAGTALLVGGLVSSAVLVGILFKAVADIERAFATGL